MSEPITWTTQKRKVRDLAPFEFNPRQLTAEQHRQLTESLKRFGLADIPIVNPDNRLIGGHQRVRVMIELGMADDVIDVRVPSRPLTEAEFKELVVRLNKNTGEWNYDVLANNFELDDLKAWGFNEAELGLGFADNDGPGGGDGPSEPKVHRCPSCNFQFKD